MFAEIKKSFTWSRDERIFEYLMFLFLSFFVIGLPTSRAIVSISQILLFSNWLIEGRFIDKFQRMSKNRTPLYLVGVFFVYALGLFWSHDLVYGFGTIMKNKLPYLSMFFVVVSSRPMKKSRIFLLPLLFSAAVIFSTFAGTIVVFSEAHTDPRDLSPFIPHIHLSMMMLLTAFFLPWYFNFLPLGKLWLFISLGVSVWMIAFLFIMGTLTGITSFAVVLFFLLIRNLIKKPGASKTVVTGVVIIFFIVSSATVINKVITPLQARHDPNLAEYSELTEHGNRYFHDFDANLRENGHLVFTFIAEDELRNAWNQRSDISFDGFDLMGNKLKHTLYRYLSSKGLRKDKSGLDTLSDDEIIAVEHGVPNYLYLEWPNVYVRIHQTFWELQFYRQTGNPSGHSFTQRLEVWRAGFVMAKKRPLFGWGTGDHLHAIQAGLDGIESKYHSFRMRHLHNQYLQLTVMLGFIGMVLIFTLYVLYIIRSSAYRYLPFNIFLVIVLVSTISESPLDSQMTLNFILFFALFFGELIQRLEKIHTTNRMNN